MRRLLVNLDNTLDEWLKGETNQTETVRKALYLYKDDISTPDTIAGLRQSYKQLYGFMEKKFEYYDHVFNGTNVSRIDDELNQVNEPRFDFSVTEEDKMASLEFFNSPEFLSVSESLSNKQV